MTTQESSVTGVPQFSKRADLERLANDFGETYFLSFLAADRETRRELGAFISTYFAEADNVDNERVSGNVLVLSAMLGALTEPQTRQLVQELADVLNRYVEL